MSKRINPLKQVIDQAGRMGLPVGRLSAQANNFEFPPKFPPELPADLAELLPPLPGQEPPEEPVPEEGATPTYRRTYTGSVPTREMDSWGAGYVKHGEIVKIEPYVNGERSDYAQPGDKITFKITAKVFGEPSSANYRVVHEVGSDVPGKVYGGVWKDDAPGIGRTYSVWVSEKGGQPIIMPDANLIYKGTLWDKDWVLLDEYPRHTIQRVAPVIEPMPGEEPAPWEPAPREGEPGEEEPAPSPFDLIADLFKDFPPKLPGQERARVGARTRRRPAAPARPVLRTGQRKSWLVKAPAIAAGRQRRDPEAASIF